MRLAFAVVRREVGPPTDVPWLLWHCSVWHCVPEPVGMGKGFGDWWPSCLGESNTHGPGFSVRGNLWASCNQVKDGKQSLVRVGAGDLQTYH